MADTLASHLGQSSTPLTDYAHCQHRFPGSDLTCLSPVIGEARFCELHAPSMEVAQEQVARRLVSLQSKSLRVLEDLMVTSSDDKVRLAASVAVLDRTGFGSKSTLAVETKPANLDLDGKNVDELRDVISRSHARMEELTRLEELALLTVSNTAPSPAPRGRRSVTH